MSKVSQWRHAPTPKFPYRQELQNESLQNLVPLIDWNYFYLAWSVQAHTEAAENLKRDAEQELQQIISLKKTEARAVISFYKVRRAGDSLQILAPKCDCPIAHPPLGTLHFLRMQESINGEPLRSIADYFSPFEDDWIGLFAASAAFGTDQYAKETAKNGDPYRALLIQTLAARLTEAYVEQLHRDVARHFWGYAPHEFWGIRPVPGYPTTPDHSEIETIWHLLKPETIGMDLTTSRMMIPESSVCGYYVAHPAARYFNISKIGQDQLKDYATRKGWTLETAQQNLERLL